MTYQVHPLADAMPALGKKKLQELVADIQANGLLEPITLYEGKILDGRNRLLACQQAGIEPCFVEFTGNNPAAFVVSKNIARRQLSPSQKAMAVAKMKEVVALLKTEAEERKRNGLNNGNKSPLPSADGNGDEGATKEDGAEASDSQEAESAQPVNKHDNTTAAILGKKAGVSEKSMERATYVQAHGTPEDVEEVESGKTSVRRKEKEIRARQAKKNSANKTSDGAPGPEQSEHQSKAEETLIRKEWKASIQALKQTLLLDPSILPLGETRDRADRFRRALQDKTIGKKARKDMKTAVEELLARCQEVLRQLN